MAQQAEYDDQQVVDYILNWLDKDDRSRVTRDDVEYVLDLIYDYYVDRGLVSEDIPDSDEELIGQAEIDENDMFDYLMKRISEDKRSTLSSDLVDQILEGEYQYGSSIGIYSEDE
ncbi:MAG: hypothetical protein IJ680_08805 [Paludibacteraceae bacterium]|nr:hypothetical protein [Paludibacteraceae bacterium]